MFASARIRRGENVLLDLLAIDRQHSLVRVLNCWVVVRDEVSLHEQNRKIPIADGTENNNFGVGHLYVPQSGTVPIKKGVSLRIFPSRLHMKV
jgi:hypothetical protein